MNRALQTSIRLAILDKCYEEGYPIDSATLTREINEQFNALPAPVTLRKSLVVFYKVLRGEIEPPQWTSKIPDFATKLEAVIKDYKEKEKRGVLKRKRSSIGTISMKVKKIKVDDTSIEPKHEVEEQEDVPISSTGPHIFANVKEEPSEDMEDYSQAHPETVMDSEHQSSSETRFKEEVIEEILGDSAISPEESVDELKPGQNRSVQQLSSEYFLDKIKFQIRSEEAKKAREKYCGQISKLKTTIFNMVLEDDRKEAALMTQAERIEWLEERLQFFENNMQNQ